MKHDPMIRRSVPGALLRAGRAAANLSQDDLADAAGVSVRCLRDYEHRQAIPAHWRTLRKVTDALELRGVELVPGHTPAIRLLPEHR